MENTILHCLLAIHLTMYSISSIGPVLPMMLSTTTPGEYTCTMAMHTITTKSPMLTCGQYVAGNDTKDIIKPVLEPG